MSARRWPLHPPPGAGEALSSWLTRIAESYGLSLEELLRHNLGAISYELDNRSAGLLDLDPGEGVLVALSERTGVALADLRLMTIAGWVPWLLDTLETSEDSTAFETYVWQDSVLLAPGDTSRHRDVPRWRPWLSAEPMTRDCPACRPDPAVEHGGFTLVSQIPLTLSCPHHRCFLEPTFGSLGTFVMWQEPRTRARPAPGPVTTMDRRTHEGLRTGTVALPGRPGQPVHVGVWFRILRTLIDELSRPRSAVRAGSSDDLARIWQASGHQPRAGLSMWRPYEKLDWPRQQMMLGAAATALHLVETGVLTARGSLGNLLAVQPYRPVDSGSRGPAQTSNVVVDSWKFPDVSDAWKQAMDAMKVAIQEAQEDPAAARRFLTLIAYPCRTPDCFDSRRRDLIACGVPEQYLPRWEDRDPRS